MPPLIEAKKAELVPLCLPTLFEAWGGDEGRLHRPYAADIELTRLGLLGSDADVVAACAVDAIRGLQQTHRPAAAGTLGQAAITLLEQAGRELPLRLLADTADALGMAGEGAAAETVLGKGESRLDGDAGSKLEPAGLSRFLFARGDRLSVHRLEVREFRDP